MGLAERLGVPWLSPREAEREAAHEEHSNTGWATRLDAHWQDYFAHWGPMARDCSVLAKTLRDQGLNPTVVRVPTGSAIIFYNHLPRAGHKRDRRNGAEPPGELDPC